MGISINETEAEIGRHSVTAETKLNNSSMYTAQKIKFSIKDFLSKCDQLRIWSHLLTKLLMENFTFCAVVIYSHTNVFVLLTHQIIMFYFLNKIIFYFMCLS